MTKSLKAEPMPDGSGGVFFNLSTSSGAKLNVAVSFAEFCVLRNLVQYPCHEGTCAFAAYGGHLETLKWLRENGCRWNEWTCAYAAKGGHLELLKWARANDCPWDESTCANAAEGGHLEVLKWAVSYTHLTLPTTPYV